MKKSITFVILLITLVAGMSFTVAATDNPSGTLAEGNQQANQDTKDECTKYSKSWPQSICLMKPSITKGAAAAVALALVFVGWYVIKHNRALGVLEPFILQILGITLILPVLLILSIQLHFAQDAVIGILGTIVGYVFGSYQQKTKDKSAKKSE